MLNTTLSILNYKIMDECLIYLNFSKLPNHLVISLHLIFTSLIVYHLDNHHLIEENLIIKKINYQSLASDINIVKQKNASLSTVFKNISLVSL